MDSRASKVVLLLVLSYVAVFAISFMNHSLNGPLLFMDFSTFPSKADYSLLLLPIAGFGFIYLLVPYLKTEFGFDRNFIKFIFPVAFIVLSVLAFLLAIYVYFLDIALRAGIGFDLSQFNINYFGMFFNSTFFYFMLGGVFGWASRLLIDHFEGSK